MSADQAQDEAAEEAPLLPPAPAPPPPGQDELPLDWQGQVFGQAPLHHLGHFLDRYDMAALETMSRGMQENARRIIRARNEELPMGKRVTNLEGPFRVWVTLRGLCLWLQWPNIEMACHCASDSNNGKPAPHIQSEGMSRALATCGVFRDGTSVRCVCGVMLLAGGRGASGSETAVVFKTPPPVCL